MPVAVHECAAPANAAPGDRSVRMYRTFLLHPDFTLFLPFSGYRSAYKALAAREFLPTKVTPGRVERHPPKGVSKGVDPKHGY